MILLLNHVMVSAGVMQLFTTRWIRRKAFLHVADRAAFNLHFAVFWRALS
jgi:hypothetical protein